MTKIAVVYGDVLRREGEREGLQQGSELLAAHRDDMDVAGENPRRDHRDGDAVARHARLLLMPSRYPEPFGMVAAEALWSGLPVILPASALLAEQVVSAEAGVAVEPRDVDSFAATIGHLLADDRRIQEMSFNALNSTRTIGLQDAEWIGRLQAIYSDRLSSAKQGRSTI